MDAAVGAVEFVSQLVAIADTFGFKGYDQEEQNRRLLVALEELDVSTSRIQELVSEAKADIQKMITLSTVIEVRSRLPALDEVREENIELLLKLLVPLKNCAHNLVFALVVGYNIDEHTVTNGFSGSSTDAIEVLMRKMDKFLRSISWVQSELTYYVTVRIRGKHDSEIEGAATAALMTIATEICESSRDVKVQNALECPMTPCGQKTIALLKPIESDDPRFEYDHLRRVFIICSDQQRRLALPSSRNTKPSVVQDRDRPSPALLTR